jgi:hypothetical protein
LVIAPAGFVRPLPVILLNALFACFDPAVSMVLMVLGFPTFFIHPIERRFCGLHVFAALLLGIHWRSSQADHCKPASGRTLRRILPRSHFCSAGRSGSMRHFRELLSGLSFGSFRCVFCHDLMRSFFYSIADEAIDVEPASA